MNFQNGPCQNVRVWQNTSINQFRTIQFTYILVAGGDDLPRENFIKNDKTYSNYISQSLKFGKLES